MIEIKGLDKVVGGRVRGVDLEIPQGHIIGLYGDNGAGKTTIMRCILGVTHFRGEITLDGSPIDKNNISRLAYASSENTVFPELSMKTHCKFFQEQFENFNKKRCDALIDFFDLKKYVNRPMCKLSTGQRNQFETILALCQGADYIFLDEPFTGNDIFNRADFYKLITAILKENETIVLSTHIIEETQNFIDRLVLLKDGRVINDVTVDEIEEMGLSLEEFVKQKYNYEEDRVSKALDKLSE